MHTDSSREIRTKTDEEQANSSKQVKQVHSTESYKYGDEQEQTAADRQQIQTYSRQQIQTAADNNRFRPHRRQQT
ncbi:hypothetical protein Tco_0739162 [Tanacetum coccineum]|uniref:Uncharacterized protein n=1 Tax=Tanacetum coccineum TaxID=301880 RepID=A0ABQ4Z921_9ASTR